MSVIGYIKHNLRLIKEVYISYGLTYTLRKIFAKIWQYLKLPTIIRFTYFGYKFFLFPTHLSHNIFSDRTYRIDEMELVKYYLSLGEVAIDVGVNIGTMTMAMAGAVGDSGRILAFEPSTRFYNYSKKNIKLNKFKNVDLYNIGLGAKNDKLFLNENRGDDTTFYVITESLGAGTPAVDIRPLDDFTIEIPEIHFLKIDVEGYEGEVLKGAVTTLQKTKTLYIEFSPDNLKNTNTDPISVLNLLGNFDLFTVDNRGGLYPFIFKQEEMSTLNILAKKKQLI